MSKMDFGGTPRTFSQQMERAGDTPLETAVKDAARGITSPLENILRQAGGFGKREIGAATDYFGRKR